MLCMSHVLSEGNAPNIPVGQVWLTPTGKTEFPNDKVTFPSTHS